MNPNTTWGPQRTAPRVTVIMRTRNVAGVVGQALAALFAQSFRDFELLVVDSASTDGTLDIVAQVPCRLEQIAAQDYVPGRVLNAAIATTRSDLLVFQNSDVVPLHGEVLACLIAAFDAPEVMAAFGRQVPRPEAMPWVRRDYAVSFPPQPPAPNWLPLSLAYAAMRRTAWQQQPFYEDAWASEDTQWGHSARTRGWRIAYVPEATVMHSHNYTLRQLYGRRFVEGEADAFIYRKHSSLFKLLRRFAGSLAADLRYQWHEPAGETLPTIVLRRAVYHWAHHHGHRLGERRRARGDADVRTGQEVVMSSLR